MTEPASYRRILDSMYGLRRFGIKLGLSTISAVLADLGNPQQHFSSIHIAGTNGKGSIASSLSLILQRAGYRVGLYTSPHLVRFNERICLDQQPISDADIVEAYQAVSVCAPAERELTFFEFTTAMAFHIFAVKQVSWAVIETGMGGRLDATNIIHPKLSIISNISLEHKEYLGRTLAQIAAEKGGIIKKQVPVVTGAKQQSVLSVLSQIAQDQSAPLYRYGKEFSIRRQADHTFNYYGLHDVWRGLKTRLSGAHQADNAALTLAGCEVLKKQGVNLYLDQIKEGLVSNNWPGRLEVVCEKPYIILDGAHNLHACKNLATFLKNEMDGRPITLVVGILNDKPYREMLASLAPLCARVIITSPKIDRALPVETLRQVAVKIARRVEVVADVAQAVKHAVETTGDREAICIAGSLYVVGEAKTGLKNIGLAPNEFKIDIRS